jgi:type IV secretory pathway TrbL component
MDDLNVIDHFMSEFIRYIDSGFGLLGGDVGFLTTTLIGIDITLAGLFWASTSAHSPSSSIASRRWPTSSSARSPPPD